jgi:hypothetical protein
MPLNLYQTTATSNLPIGSSYMDATAGPTYLVNVLQDLKATIRALSLMQPWQSLVGLESSSWTGSLAWTYIGATQASIQGDQSSTGTSYLVVNTRVRAFVTGPPTTILGYITAISVAGSAPNQITTVTFFWYNGNQLDAGLSDIQFVSTGTVLANVPTQTTTPLTCDITNGGSGPTFTGTLAPGIGQYTVNQTYWIGWFNTSVGNDTINLNGIGAVQIMKTVGGPRGGLVALSANDIVAGSFTPLVYNGVNFLYNIPFDTPAGIFSSSHLQGVAGTGTFAFTADQINCSNPTAEGTIQLTGFGATNTIATAGPILNGRDQSGAFSSAATVHFYAISGPSETAGTISSLTGPPTGPTLPTGYTNWAYLCSVVLQSGSMPVGQLRGNYFALASGFAVLSAGTGASFTPVTMDTYIPTIAQDAEVQLVAHVQDTTTGTGTQMQLVASQDGTNTVASVYAAVKGEISSTGLINESSMTLMFPNNNTTQYFYYKVANVVGSGTAEANATVMGYTVPNNAS